MNQPQIPEFPDDVTIGDKYQPAMEVQTKGDAAAYFEGCVRHTIQRFGTTREEAERIERANIGYFAGYYGDETGERVYRLYGVNHPIFGDMKPTAEEAFDAGARIGLGIDMFPKP